MAGDRGFSIIELLTAVIIIGLMMTIIIPVAQRLNVQAKYSVVRQNCSELGSFATQWVQKSINAQDTSLSTATIADYFATLAGEHRAPDLPADAAVGQWIAVQNQPNNWHRNKNEDAEDHEFIYIYGRWMGGKNNTVPEDVVEDIIPGERTLDNPFTKKNVFSVSNDPVTMAHVVAGAIALGGVMDEDGFIYYAFCFQGAESTAVDLSEPAAFFNDQDLHTLRGLRNGMFLAHVR